MPPTPPTAAGDVRSVLFVCTGNICRSPLAERLLRARCAHLEVRSAGIDALVGSPIESRAAEEIRRRGASAAGFEARQVTPADLTADLVLVMSARQRAVLIDEDPSAARRIGLLGDLPRLADAFAQHGSQRPAIDGWTRSAPRAQHDIPDPYHRSDQLLAQVAARIDLMVSALATFLVPGGVR